MDNLDGFKPIRACPNWLINEKGEVYSLNSKSILKNQKSGTGYQQLIYHAKSNENGKIRKKHYIHRLVAEVFIGEIPKGMVVNHIDGDKSNNHVSNLEIVTSYDNNKHARDNNLNPLKGSNHPNSVLKEKDVIQIREHIEKGLTDAEIAKIYNVNKSTIYSIRNGGSWGWL